MPQQGVLHQVKDGIVVKLCYDIRQRCFVCMMSAFLHLMMPKSTAVQLDVWALFHPLTWCDMLCWRLQHCSQMVWWQALVEEAYKIVKGAIVFIYWTNHYCQANCNYQISFSSSVVSPACGIWEWPSGDGAIPGWPWSWCRHQRRWWGNWHAETTIPAVLLFLVWV